MPQAGISQLCSTLSLVPHSTCRWLSWTSSVPMMGESSSTANWSHSNDDGGARNQLPREGAEGSSHSPIVVSPDCPQQATAWKSQANPQGLFKEKGRSQKGLNRGQPTYSHLMSVKWGHPNETSHSFSLNPSQLLWRTATPWVSFLQPKQSQEPKAVQSRSPRLCPKCLNMYIIIINNNNSSAHMGTK